MLKGKTALITGTARRLGKAFVEEFAKNGANVIAHARKETPEFMRMIADVSQKYGVSVTPVFFDMTDAEAMKNAIFQAYNAAAMNVSGKIKENIGRISGESV